MRPFKYLVIMLVIGLLAAACTNARHLRQLPRPDATTAAPVQVPASRNSPCLPQPR